MQPPAGTRLADVMDALATAFGAISGVNSVIGPNPQTLTEDDTIEVGVSAISVRNEKAAGLGIAYTEIIQLPCRVWSFSGDFDMVGRRDRCIELLEQIRAVLAADVTVGRTCDQALVGPSWTGIPVSDSKGVSFQIGFTISVKATI